jgi:hypothetical protein
VLNVQVDGNQARKQPTGLVDRQELSTKFVN